MKSGCKVSVARMDAGKKDASRIEEAVEVVAMAIDNLRDVHSELFPC